MKKFNRINHGALSCMVVALFSSAIPGCGERVNLGGSTPDFPPEDPGMGGDGSTSAATTIYRFKEPIFDCNDLAVDGNYLYVSTSEMDGPSIRRCEKKNCAATFQRIAGPFCVDCPPPRIALTENRLGVATGPKRDAAELDTCTAPDCRDWQTVIGGLPSLADILFERDRAYFSVLTDRTIYRCDLPKCGSPEVFASGSMATKLRSHGDWIYWTDQKVPSVKRKRKDGNSNVETLEFREVLTIWMPGDPAIPQQFTAGTFAIDGDWLYARPLQNENEYNKTCEERIAPCTIFRWPLDAPSGAREAVITSTKRDDISEDFAVLDGELVFDLNNQAQSCDASRCAATQRSLGLANSERLVSDGENLFWCTRNQASPEFGAIQRIPRIPR